MVIHYEEALYQVYAPLPLPFRQEKSDNTLQPFRYSRTSVTHRRTREGDDALMQWLQRRFDFDSTAVQLLIIGYYAPALKRREH